jgi:hypothetical protein
MGTDELFHKRKARKAESHRRKKAMRAPYERVLIVCEGMKTEPNYFKALRREQGLHPANVVIEDKKSGLDPKSLVLFALEVFRKDKDYEHVFCVFDKDKHASYSAALDKIRSTRLKGAKLHAITSVPCFEVWILLHFTYTTHAFIAAGGDSNCALVIEKLDKKGRIPGYEKGSKDIFNVLRDKLETAIKNAGLLEDFHKTSGTDNPSTKVHKLILHLKSLKR